MTEREMLELAALAAGIVRDSTDDSWYQIGGGWCRPDWNPLTDDGDALRLAVKLRFWVKDFAPHDEPQIVQAPPNATPMGMIEIWREDDEDPIHVEWYKPGADRYAATRLAITRAAAEIGKTLKEQQT